MEKKKGKTFIVVIEAPWLVHHTKSISDSVKIAVSEAGKKLNEAKMQFVDVEVGTTPCPICSESFESAFLVAGTALVGLQMTMKVYNAQSDEHASRIAKLQIGKALKDVPLKVIETRSIE
ncbi:MAG: DUF555 domain-containing protein [Euryarchaeota archaeon]|nr:DUF555 domain-containing protein [Euryarchaeota archaeon]